MQCILRPGDRCFNTRICYVSIDGHKNVQCTFIGGNLKPITIVKVYIFSICITLLTFHIDNTRFDKSIMSHKTVSSLMCDVSLLDWRKP